MQRFKRKARQGTIFFSPTSNEIQKRFPNRREISNEILECMSIPFFPNSPNKTMKAKMPKFAIASSVRDGTPVVKKSVRVAGITILRLAKSKSLPHNFQLKGQWIIRRALVSAAEKHKGQNFGDKAM